jgi:hypothetical protein
VGRLLMGMAPEARPVPLSAENTPRVLRFGPPPPAVLEAELLFQPRLLGPRILADQAEHLPVRRRVDGLVVRIMVWAMGWIGPCRHFSNDVKLAARTVYPPRRYPGGAFSRHSTGRPIVSARPIGSAIVRSIRNTDQR